MRIERRLGIRTAYGQLVLIVFLPIAILATVGGLLVFFETSRIVKSKQDALAQAALIRYEPIIAPLLPSLTVDDYQKISEQIQSFGINGMTAALLPSESAVNVGRHYVGNHLYRIWSNQHVLRVAVMDEQGDVIVSTGVDADLAWGKFDTQSDGVWRLKTAVGTAYGMPIVVQVDGNTKRFWLFVDMDDEPTTIANYRILLALAVTGLITILLLLLILNLYSKRWITPVYEMRLFLQKISSDTLDSTLRIKTDGELTLLQREINTAINRLHQDFSELKRHSIETETDLQQAFDEMEMQNISIRQARDEALEASAAKSSFLANISHELRTPLNAIDGFINLLARNDSLTGKPKIYIQTIQKSSAHLLALINDVLDFSKIEAGKISLESESFDLHEVIYEVADMLSPAAFDKALRMGVLIYNDVPDQMVGDKLRVKQILTNLLGNAIKFTDSGSVEISVQLDDDGIYVQIKDTGRGIDKHSANKLFQSFSQGDLSITRRYGGTGLGLVISQELVALMGGTIGFFDNQDTDKPTQGTTFWIRLPVSGQLATHDIALPSLHLAVWLSHPFAMQSMKAYLAGGHVQVTYALSLAQLLDLLANQHFDWVIADSFGQAGDLTALLRQLRSYHKNHLAIYGYQIGFDLGLMQQYQALCLHEPLSRRALVAMLSHKITPQKTLNLQGIKVLAVDDHMPNLLVLEALLGEYGVCVIQATSGVEALDRVTQALDNSQTLGVDLIFMDIQMPHMSGIETALAIGNLVKTHACPKVPIVALSAHGLATLVDENTDTKTALAKMGFDAFATKPILQADLVNLLQKFVDPTNTDTATPTDDDLLTNNLTNNNLANNNLANNHLTDGNLTDNNLTKNNDDKSANLTAIDKSLAIVRAGGNAQLAEQLLLLMKDNVQSDLASLQYWQHRLDTPQSHQAIYDIAHKTVGATRYTGTPQIENAAYALERFMLDNRLVVLAQADNTPSGDEFVHRLANTAVLQQHVQQLVQAFGQFLGAWHKHDAQHQHDT